MDDFLGKMRKRREINRKISNLRDLINDVERIKDTIERHKVKMTNEMECWELQYDQYMQLELAPDINIVDSFEGMAAEQLALDVPPMVTEINNICSQISGVISGITDQVVRIDDYIAEINVEIAELKSQLDALWA